MTKQETRALVAKWTEALRSGMYEQTTGVLCRSTEMGLEQFEYCCLGVLADVARIKSTHSYLHREYEFPRSGRSPAYATSMIAGDLDEAIRGHLGLTPEALVHLNDEKGFTFEQIADVVDAFAFVKWGADWKIIS